MEFSFVLFLLIVGSVVLAATVTTLHHLIRRAGGTGRQAETHHNSREDAWYWSARVKRKSAGAGH